MLKQLPAQTEMSISTANQVEKDFVKTLPLQGQ